MKDLYEWLLEGAPWVEYRTRIDLLQQSEDEPEVREAKKRIKGHPQIKALLAELKKWPGPALKSHKDAAHLIHKLVFIADVGLSMEDKDIEIIVSKILKCRSPEGPFEVILNIPTHFGGTGTDTLSWILCDAPAVIFALIEFGLIDNMQVIKAVEHLAPLIRDNGWPCFASPVMGKFRGPGRKDDPCPYANLLMLKVLSRLPDRNDSRESRVGIESALSLWELRKEKKPYLFAMGTDFKKLKAPLIWYDILHVTDVLTRFPFLKNDERLCEMIDIIKAKKDNNGYYKAESVWRAWKDWDFGQKKTPSKWITFLSHRITSRLS
jgi:hypothetical protein